MNELYEETDIKPKRAVVPSSEELPDALTLKYRHPAYLLISDFEALDIFRREPNSQRGKEMMQELLRRHHSLLRKIAWKMSVKYTRSHTFDDFMQHAYIGAIIAYNRFDFSKTQEGKNKLSSFVHLTVEKYLLDAMNRDAFIQCPPHKRAIRSYLAGRYDNQPEKKKIFEEKNGLTTELAREQAREKYKGLSPDLVSFEMKIQNQKHGGDQSFAYADIVQDASVDIEEDLVTKLDLELAMRQLTERQRLVCQLVMQEEYTNQEAADRLSVLLGTGVTEGMVRSDIRAIRQIMRNAL